METTMKILILTGTMTGTADMVAEEMASAAGPGITAEIVPMDDSDPSVLDGASACVICTATYGDGEVPDGAKPFYEKLAASAADLSGLRYGVVALGDSSYDTFCQAGKSFDATLAAHGATRLGELLCCDASSGELPEDQGRIWFEQWQTLAAQAA
jgi:MioC protein